MDDKTFKHSAPAASVSSSGKNTDYPASIPNTGDLKSESGATGDGSVSSENPKGGQAPIFGRATLADYEGFVLNWLLVPTAGKISYVSEGGDLNPF